MDNLRIPNSTSLIYLEVLAEASRTYVENSLALNTRRAYRADWKHFTQWCEQHHLESLPATPDTIALYLGETV